MPHRKNYLLTKLILVTPRQLRTPQTHGVRFQIIRKLWNWGKFWLMTGIHSLSGLYDNCMSVYLWALEEKTKAQEILGIHRCI